ncbi:hypothetical protein KVR01_004518 [Diaporthe batatas]|uniref:uncharacterized protein n=1 Tax=Diaporthe batatas TaxID=748121 RepID=UPI001D045F13|nr:uncharacterized protein KVR01_004518 [Diaporthe batatas]KAG8165966.1 hypothetical protein KVR01_004518 [Diaporthe batatas]
MSGSKSITGFLDVAFGPNKAKVLKNAKSTAVQSGHARIFPTQSKDKAFDLRLDGGPLSNDGKKPFHFQVNAQAKSQGLITWVGKQGSKGTHADLAVEVFDTKAKDQDAEAKRVHTSLEKQALANLKAGKAAK